ncbi:hypothetical protein MMC26_005560 [Xylographa opegraphella]|nr:hypothetical protein [Xylographa opegraphella]
MHSLIQSCVVSGQMVGGTSLPGHGFVFTVVNPAVVNVANTCMANHGPRRTDISECVISAAIRATHGLNAPNPQPNVRPVGQQTNLLGPSVINPMGGGPAGGGMGSGMGGGMMGGGPVGGGPVGGGAVGGGPVGGGMAAPFGGGMGGNSAGGAHPGSGIPAGAGPSNPNPATAPMPDNDLDPAMLDFVLNLPFDGQGRDSAVSDSSSSAFRPPGSDGFDPGPSNPGLSDPGPSDPGPSARGPSNAGPDTPALAGAGPPAALPNTDCPAARLTDRSIPAEAPEPLVQGQRTFVGGTPKFVAGTWAIEDGHWVDGWRKAAWKTRGGWWLALGNGARSPYPGNPVPAYPDHGARPVLVTQHHDRSNQPLSEAWIAEDGQWKPLEGNVPPNGAWQHHGGWILLKGSH